MNQNHTAKKVIMEKAGMVTVKGIITIFRGNYSIYPWVNVQGRVLLLYVS